MLVGRTLEYNRKNASGELILYHPTELILMYEEAIESAFVEVVCRTFLIKINVLCLFIALN
jgi:hypothetical protein